MAFRVRQTAQADYDLDIILEWLLAQQAGEAGLRWFRKLKEAVTSLSELPERCPLAPENADFLSRCGSFSMAVSHISTGSCSPSKPMWLSFFIFATAAAGSSENRIRTFVVHDKMA
jgi:plasmid stabilization system protein ParE